MLYAKSLATLLLLFTFGNTTQFRYAAAACRPSMLKTQRPIKIKIKIKICVIMPANPLDSVDSRSVEGLALSQPILRAPPRRSPTGTGGGGTLAETRHLAPDFKLTSCWLTLAYIVSTTGTCEISSDSKFIM